ncbi:MAG: thermonuclease family protein [Desulfovibrio sp.]|nr:thermonuclease family protein [Desulfovibrio sp.]
MAFVVRVEDGGTIAVAKWPDAEKEDELVRMYGIRTPSLLDPYGQEARKFLLGLLPKGTKIELQTVNQTSEDGLEEVLVQVAGKSLNYSLLYEGLAWVDRATCKSSYCRRWYIVEHNSVESRKGLWSLELETPPWQWSH